MNRILSSTTHLEVTLASNVAQRSDIKLGLAEDEVALVKQITFHASMSDVDAELFMGVSARANNDTIITPDHIEESGAMIARFVVNNASTGGFLWSFVHPIPDPYWIVSGDLQLIAASQTNPTIDVGVQVYFVTKKVSLFDWMISKKAY